MLESPTVRVIARAAPAAAQSTARPTSPTDFLVTRFPLPAQDLCKLLWFTTGCGGQPWGDTPGGRQENPVAGAGVPFPGFSGGGGAGFPRWPAAMTRRILPRPEEIGGFSFAAGRASGGRQPGVPEQ